MWDDNLSCEGNMICPSGYQLKSNLTGLYCVGETCDTRQDRGVCCEPSTFKNWTTFFLIWLPFVYIKRAQESVIRPQIRIKEQHGVTDGVKKKKGQKIQRKSNKSTKTRELKIVLINNQKDV